MLSNGLAAVLSNRSEIYDSFLGDLLFFAPSEIHHGRILCQGIHKYIEIFIPTEYFPDFQSYDALFNDKSDGRTNILSPAPKERAVILSLAEKIVNIIKNHSDGISLFSHLIELLKICTRLYTKLLRNQYSVTDAASMSGFCDSSVFIKRFKKSFGITPLKYKKLCNCAKR